jgi:hypothetical protein
MLNPTMDLHGRDRRIDEAEGENHNDGQGEGRDGSKRRNAPEAGAA